MPQTNPMTQTINASEARRGFSQLLNEVFRGEKRVVVEKSGIPVAAIISAADLERFTRYEEECRQDMQAIESIREAFKDVDPEEIEREAVRAVREVRRENWEREQATRNQP